jgi:hypothetical protein
MELDNMVKISEVSPIGSYFNPKRIRRMKGRKPVKTDFMWEDSFWKREKSFNINLLFYKIDIFINKKV